MLLQGEMEQALENYDVCTEMLQHSAALEADPDSNKRVVIRLPNLHVDSVVSLEEVTSPGCLFLVTLLAPSHAYHLPFVAGSTPGYVEASRLILP